MELGVETQSRPWQGTVLGVLNIIGLVSAGMMLLLLSFGGSLLSEIIQDSQFSMIMGIGKIVLLILIIPFIILGFFVTIGTFKGQKWAVIVMMIFTVLGLLSALSSLFYAEVHNNPIMPLLINGFVLYCEIASLKSPYYK